MRKTVWRKGATISDLNQARVDFNLALARIYKPESQEKGVIQCQEMLEQGGENSKLFRIFMGALLDKSLLKTGTQSAYPMSFHASLFGDMAKSFKTNFKDPIDKPAKRTKTYERVLQFFIQHFFTQNIDEQKKIIDKGCSIAMCMIAEHVFPELLESEDHAEQFYDTFMKPLTDLLQRIPRSGNRDSSPSNTTSGSLQQATSVGFCLRIMFDFLKKSFPHMIT